VDWKDTPRPWGRHVTKNPLRSRSSKGKIRTVLETRSMSDWTCGEVWEHFFHLQRGRGLQDLELRGF
jgi:hypothetical protein